MWCVSRRERLITREESSNQIICRASTLPNGLVKIIMQIARW
jgi:hypothetical protein